MKDRIRIAVASRRRGEKSLRAEFGDAELIDVTSKGDEPWVRFSPFFPHGGIPVPDSPGITAQSVEGIWQGLKVFESTDVDPSRFDVTAMKGLKRTVRRFGRVLGHRAGVNGEELLPYEVARRRIYLPSYRWVLEHRLETELQRLRDIAADAGVVLLDYETNTNVEDLSRPLSHASLVCSFLEDDWPV